MNMKTKHHPLRTILLSLLILLLLVLVVFVGFYFTRLQTIQSIEQITDYDDGYNLYRMNVQYDYSLDRVIAYGITDNQTMLDAILKEALPLLPISMKVPNYGCTAFTLTDTDGSVHMGRNYDFKRDTSAMLVYCAPKDGYRSVAFAALDNVSANIPDESLKKKLATLTAPFICLDGMNEKGVSIAVLTLDSEPVHQNTGKPTIATTLAIRLVLDRAATTEEAVQLLSSYDMFASSGRDYHSTLQTPAAMGVSWNTTARRRLVRLLQRQWKPSRISTVCTETRCFRISVMAFTVMAGNAMMRL